MMELRNPDQLKGRILAIDIVRGLVMVIMAIDHVREFWNPGPIRPEDIAQVDFSLFFTRWITHLCAPTFIFLSGVSIFLFSQHKQSIKETSLFLVTRGIWLILIEIALMSPLVTHGYSLVLMGVFWVIGISMICMAGIIHLPQRVIVIISILIIAGHGLLPNIQPVTSTNFILASIHNSPFFLPGSPALLMPYTILPWLAVMMLGYSLGSWFTLTEVEKNGRFVATGIALILLFIAIRLFNSYGDPSAWSVQSRGLGYTTLSFLNVSKYPASLLFLCLTLGTAMILIATLGTKNNLITRVLSVYGQVPFFFFVIHFLLVSAGSLIWGKVAFGSFINFAFTQTEALPSTYQPSLPRTYLVWIIVLLITYYPCKWFSNYKKENRKWWLSYL